jgi:PAS domain S-box-containing protein
MSSQDTRAILRVVVPYVVFAVLWILLSDRLLAKLLPDPTARTQWSIYVGCAFVLVTAVLLSALLRVALKARDVTEPRRAEEQARVSQIHLSYLTKYANDLIILLDDNFRFLETNERVIDSYGYTREELIGMHATQLRAAETKAFFREQAKPDGLTGSVVYETVHQRKDGTTFPVEISLRAIDIDAKRFYQAIIRDITERKRAEEALRESEGRLRQAQTVAGMGFLDWNLKTNEIFLSDDACRIHGLERQESLVAPALVASAVHPDDIGFVTRALDDALQGVKEYDIDHRVVWPNGTVRWVRAQAQLRKDAGGTPERLLGTVVDITERKRMEEALRESERKYRELVEYANSIILRWTREGRIAYLNEFGQRFFGYTADEICGRHVIGTLVPETESSGRNLPSLMDEICADPAGFEQSVNENMRRNGERVWIAWTNRIVLDQHGQVAEILSIGADITARKRVEEELRATQASLEQRVIERTAELAAAKERAEAADRVKSAFLATMSHELRTPLNSVIGFTGLLLQGLAGPLNAEQTKQLRMVKDSGQHLLALINDVLDISKIEAGQIEIANAPFDLPESIRKVVQTVTPLAGKKQLPLTVKISPDVGRITSDRRRVEQILLNLLNNAIKFTERGQITLAAETAPGMVRISVIDTGVGIKAEDLGKLFQPFRQLDTGLTRQHEGTGLGLAICRRLAERLGGTISVESQLSQGSMFTFTLPLAESGTS